MTPTQVQQIIDTLNHAAGAGWKSLVQQQFLVGISELIIVGIFLLVGLISIIPLTMGIHRAKKGYNNRKDGNYDSKIDNGWWYWNFLSGGSACLVVTAFFLLVFLAPDAINHLIDPAAYAIQSLSGLK